MAEEFGVAVMRIKADDDQLKRTLKEDEAVVKTSVGKMQGDLNKLQMSTAATGTAAMNAGGMFSAFGAEVSAVGGTVGMVGGKVASLGGAFAALGPALLGPAGAILAVSAALTVLVQKWVDAKEAAKNYAVEQKRMAKEEEERQQKINKTFVQGAVKRAQEMEQMERKTGAMRAEVEGPVAVLEASLRQRLADIEAQEFDILGLAGTGGFGEVERWATLATLGPDQKRQLELLSEQRALSVEKTNRDIQKIEEDRRKIEEAAEKAHNEKIAQDRLQAMAKAQATPLGQVLMGMQGVTGATARETAIEGILGGMGLGGNATLRRALGLSVDTAAPAGPQRGGHMLLESFAASGRAGAGPQFARPREEQRDDQQAKDIAAIKKVADRIGYLLKIDPKMFVTPRTP